MISLVVCVCAYMDLTQATAQLGYKWNFERRGDPPHHLITVEDVNEAFERALKLSSSKRQKKDVILEVVNLVSHVCFAQMSCINPDYL